MKTQERTGKWGRKNEVKEHERKKLEKWLKIGAIAFVAVLLIGAANVGSSATKANGENKIDIKVKAIVKEIEEVHCKMSDQELLKDPSGPLTREDIRKVRKFCALPTKEKEKRLKKEFEKAEKKECSEGEIIAYNNTYTCYYDGINFGIPNYADLGLNSSTCTWHDAPGNPTDCKIEGKIACLWGCTNYDPVLGWHIKEFDSVSELENEIFSKGYHAVSENYGGSYRRWVGYGYTYQVHYWGDYDGDGKPEYHSEGPEPGTEFNWYAYLRGWWPVEVSHWHYVC